MSEFSSFVPAIVTTDRPLLCSKFNQIKQKRDQGAEDTQSPEEIHK